MKSIFVLLLCLGLCGCASIAMNKISKEVTIGMTEKQVKDIEGCPTQRSRQIINGKTYETWGYTNRYTFDFVDGALTGFGGGGIYISQNGREEAKNLK